MFDPFNPFINTAISVFSLNEGDKIAMVWDMRSFDGTFRDVAAAANWKFF